MSIRIPATVSAALIVVMLALAAWVGPHLPPTMPLRFDEHGVAVVHGNTPYFLLGLMPVLALALSAVVAFKMRSGPRGGNLARPAIAWIGVVAFLTLVHGWLMYALMTSAQGRAPANPLRLIFG